ncbi:cell filamentation protein Fic [Scytonema hofmannii PCC 7110]|uniref:Cell filamentation protein Fic n=1 Tax=Scytonema hofmannii PCC 7110 TaxID=128403 RepID=A0A139XG24_9CYAN|nr:Fic family protein [Scytonema hofmannii]KYC43647.1 cell filamentation protein Fic [Scytonema hofmannii PCC 7110]
MERGLQGDYIPNTTTSERFLAFVPRPLPPVPPLQLDSNLYDLIERANRALGRLDGLTTLLPEPSLFLYLYVRKEALLSSKIEGTQSSFSDLLLYEIEEAPGVPLNDVQEVSRYVAALNHGLTRLREGFPLSLRLIREIHQVLLSGGRGSERTPGEFRRTQNWVGGTRPGNALFVPPPPTEVIPCLGSLEKFLHDEPERTPVLIKAALSHVQFESIHPFLDGNGRLGRLLITFLLCAEGALSEPLLYLSLYFKTHRQLYYDLLQQVRIKGDWEAWLIFFLEGVMVTSEQASSTARRLLTLFENDRQRLGTLGRGANSTLRLHNLMRKKPLFSITHAKNELGLTIPTVTSALKNLESLGMVKEITGRRRDRLFVYNEYLSILNEGIDS